MTFETTLGRNRFGFDSRILDAMFPAFEARLPQGDQADSTLEEIDRQKLSNYQAMIDLGNDLSTCDQALIRAAVEAAFICHADHVRLGTPVLHYSSHLLGVAQRVKANISEIAEQFFTPDGQALSLRAVAIVVALLHDTEEDIGKTFNWVRDRKEAYPLVDRFLRSKLGTCIDAAGLDRIMNTIRLLSIDNEYDIPDSFYIEQIESDPLARQIKPADVDHNMETMPKISPMSGAVIFPAQVGALMAASPYAERFLRQVCECARHSCQSIDIAREPQNSIERKMKLFLMAEGELVGPRLVEFYRSLCERIEHDADSTLIAEGTTHSKVMRALKTQLANAEQIGSAQYRSRVFPERKMEVDGNAVTLLGPVRGWLGEVRTYASRELIESAVRQTAEQVQSRVSGYLVSYEDGSTGFQMFRAPRRAGAEVRSIAEYSYTLETIAAHIQSRHFCTLQINSHPGEQFRALIGREEGHFDGRRRALLERTDIHTPEALRAAFVSAVGEPADFGLSEDMFEDLKQARSILQRTHLTKVHTVADIHEQLQSDRITVTPVDIFAVDPVTVSTYQEPAALLIGDMQSDLPRQLIRLANHFHQARVSLLWERELSESYAIEIDRVTASGRS